MDRGNGNVRKETRLLEVNIKAYLATAWHWYAQAAGIGIIAGAISYCVLAAFSVNGPVVQVIEGPSYVSASVPYKGTLTYRISTKRNLSCPGTVITTFMSQNGGPPVSVLLTRPIMSTEIKQTDDATLYLQLPENVYPGRWLYRSVVDSTCPTHSRQDVTAQFPFQVTANVD
ncbi:hypothetical protein GR217_34500 [Rhizobium leguminosarum]|uniref:Uncharacterized protein n=1 Tax=Rhizobium ruizarguesonis TaxID=2081791 RepID=A0AAE4Z0G0_9HYPH|nr:hypothetical protein [Rhizobium ruizarguesonis]NEI52732.1 hypothetical protein [Rhizobium ruizarguesonis]